MFGIILLTCLVSVAQGISYGEFARRAEIPYIALIHWYSPGHEHICGGTVLDDKYILTSAVCAAKILEDNEESVLIYLGSVYRHAAGVSPYRVKKIINHPNYDPVYFRNDIALIHVYPDISFSEEVQPINISTTYTREGSICKASGWGLTEKFLPAYRLKYDSYEVEDITYCKRYNDYFNSFFQLCVSAYKKVLELGAGDTGGPLVCGDRLVGVYSKNPKGTCCGGPDYAYFTNVTYYAEWIYQNML